MLTLFLAILVVLLLIALVGFVGVVLFLSYVLAEIVEGW